MISHSLGRIDFAKYISDKELLAKIHKEHKTPRQQENTISFLKKKVKDLNRYLIKEDTQVENKHMRDASHHMQ